jgi:hypothetical protein
MAFTRVINSSPPRAARRLARLDRFADGTQLGLGQVRRPHRNALRKPVGGRSIADEILHDAVLERVEAHDREPPSRLEEIDRAGQRHLQLFKLLIEVNPKSLKGPCRRVLARLARANRATHDLGKLPGGADRLASPCLNNLCCNCLSKPFFPIERDHLPDLFFGGAREPLGRGLAACRVHAHVERSVPGETESARGLLELRARDAQVQQHTGHLADSAGGERLFHRRKPRVDQLKTRIFVRAIRMRRGVLIKSEKSSANTETGEDGLAVPAAAKGAIDVGFAFTDVEGKDSFFE